MEEEQEGQQQQREDLKTKARRASELYRSGNDANAYQLLNSIEVEAVKEEEQQQHATTAANEEEPRAPQQGGDEVVNAKYTVFMNRGALHLKHGKFDKALRDFDCALLLREDSLGAMANRATALIGLGRYQEANDQYSDCLDVEPQLYNALCGKAETFTKMRQYPESIETFTAAIEVCVDHHAAYVGRAYAHLQTGDISSAVQDLKSAYEYGDVSPDTCQLLSITIAVQGDRHLSNRENEEALTCYAYAIKVDPKKEPNPNILHNQAVCQLRLGRTEDAIVSFVKTVEVDPHRSEACSALGMLYMEQGAFMEAEKYLKMALTDSPNDVHVLHNLGVCLIHHPQQTDTNAVMVEEAVGYFKRVLDLDPENQDATKALEVIASAQIEDADLEHQQQQPPQDEGDDWQTTASSARGYNGDDEVGDDDLKSLPMPLDEQMVRRGTSGGGTGTGTPSAASARSRPSYRLGSIRSSVSFNNKKGPTSEAPELPEAPQQDLPAKVERTASDMNCSVDMAFSYDELSQRPFPMGVDPSRRESYLTEDEFKKVFEMHRDEFYGLPKWRQAEKKKFLGLF